MTREWKPGDVALVNVSGGRWIPGVLDHNDDWTLALPMDDFDGGWVNNDPGEIAVRPLVIIDPEDREQVEAFAAAYRNVHGEAELTDEPWSIPGLRMQAALREFANLTPPKPDEPQGLGAVVEDEAGANFTRVGVDCWVRRGGGLLGFGYAEINAVRVLSEGVS